MDDLLIKYLVGEVTPDEAARVKQWISADAGNRQRFEQFRATWEISGRNTLSAVPDAQQALQRLKRKLHTAATVPVHTTPALYRFLRTWRAAAVFAGIVCVGIGTYLMVNRPGATKVTGNQKKTQPVQRIEPGIAKSDSAGTTDSLQTTIAGDNPWTETLPDGSVVTLKKHTHITYPVGLKGSTRTVRLQGTAFFSVAHNPSRPFVVYVNDVTVKVLGTSFNISSIAGSTEVVVKTGVVRVIRGVDSLTLYAGEKVVYQKGRRQVEKRDTASGKKHFQRPPANSFVEESKQVMRTIIADIIQAKIIANRDSLIWLALDNRHFVVNGHTMPDALHRIFRSRYIKPDGRGYYYGPNKVRGGGFCFNKGDLYQ